MELTPLATILLTIFGAAVSLAFRMIPKLADWYEKQHGKKAIIMIAFLLLISALYFGLGCTPMAGQLGITTACSWDGATTIIMAFITLLGSNQVAYILAGGNQVTR